MRVAVRFIRQSLSYVGVLRSGLRFEIEAESSGPVAAVACLILSWLGLL